MSGAENLKCVPGREFLVRWRIKNFTMFGTKEKQIEETVSFLVPLLGNTEWYLKLLFEKPQESNIMCFLCRDEDDGPDCVKAIYSISAYSSYVVEPQTFAKKSSCFVPAIINQDRFNDDVDCGLSRDVLQVECRLWPDSSAEVLTLVRPYPVGTELITTIPKLTRSMFHKIPNFSNIPDGQAIEFTVAVAGSLPLGTLVSRLWIEHQTLRVLVRELYTSQTSFVLKCNVHLLDHFRDRHLLYRGRAVVNYGEDPSFKTMKFSLAMSRKQLMEKKDLYLPGDELLLHWEFVFSHNRSVVNRIDQTLYDEPSDLQVNREVKWGIYLERKYNEHRLFCRLLALLVVVVSVLPHLLFDNT